MKSPQKQHIHHIIFICLLMVVGWGQLDKYEPYLSPGIQIGFNSKMELFYGFQISMGVTYSPEKYIYSPSICFGLKKYFNSNIKEKYIDLQIMSLPDGRIDGGFPIGFGVGKNFIDSQSNIRIKGYTWFVSCLTFDYNFKKKLSNLSLIPVFPITESM
tara:strand:+ start:1080 stop:1553 length:474 start_codon:yes stop_codon:yes gene_type:complete